MSKLSRRVNLFTCILQVITEYDDSQLEDVLGVTERLNAHLTAAVVSNDVLFLGKARLHPCNCASHCEFALKFCSP